MRHLYAAALCLVCFGSYATSESNPLHISKDGLSEFTGRYELENTALSFSSYAPNDKTVDVRVKINGKVFEADFDLYHENLHVDGHGAKLETAEKNALLQASEAITQYVQEQYYEFDPQYFMLIRILNYWAHAPAGYSHVQRDIVSGHQPPEERP